MKNHDERFFWQPYSLFSVVFFFWTQDNEWSNINEWFQKMMPLTDWNYQRECCTESITVPWLPHTVFGLNGTTFLRISKEDLNLVHFRYIKCNINIEYCWPTIHIVCKTVKQSFEWPDIAYGNTWWYWLVTCISRFEFPWFLLMRLFEN